VCLEGKKTGWYLPTVRHLDDTIAYFRHSGD
jgi:hypothetical protein